MKIYRPTLFLSGAIVLAGIVLGRADSSKATGWKIYENPKLGIQVGCLREWPTSEYSDATNSAYIAFAVSRPPEPDVNIVISRDRVDPRFEIPTSTRALNVLYQPGYRISTARLAGKEAVFVEGTVISDGRHEQSYYIRKDGFDYRMALTAPENRWKDFSEVFGRVRNSLVWLPTTNAPAAK